MYFCMLIKKYGYTVICIKLNKCVTFVFLLCCLYLYFKHYHKMFPSKCSSIHIMESVELQGWVAAGS